MITEEYVPFHKVIKLLEDFTNRHYDLNAFGFGNLLEYGKDIEDRTLLYPVLFVVPQTITYDEQQTAYSISVIIADRLSDDLHNRVSAISNMNMIAKDLIGEIKLGDLQQYFDTEIPATATSFIERMEDNVGGVALDITLTTLDPLNVCDRFMEPVSYEPSQLEGLYAWYDFQDQSTLTLGDLAGEIQQVLDKSGNNFTLTPFNSSPDYSASTYNNSNGYYAMWDKRNLTGLIHNTPTKTWSEATTFVVYTKPSTSGVKSFMNVQTGSTSNVTTSPLGVGQINTDLSVWSNFTCREVETYTPYEDTDFVINRMKVSSTTLGDFVGDELSVHGTLNANPNDCGVQNTNQTDYIILGDTLLTGPDVENGIFEVIIYDRALTDVEYDGVLEYLKLKYNYSYWV